MTNYLNHNHDGAPALCLDFYQLTTAQAHFHQGTHETWATFDYYFRKSPFQENSFAIFSGLEHFITYINNLRFTDYQIEYLRSLKRFSDDFLTYLANFSFTGNAFSLKEGTLTGAESRNVIIEAPVLECHLIESHLLNIFNSETNWTSLAVRLKHAAKEEDMWEGGLRRAQGIDASIWAARCGYLGGMSGTSNVEAGYRFGIPVVGTHPHAWIQAHDSEYDAFLNYYRANPANTSLLVDTYDVLESGVPNAIKIAKLAESEGNKVKSIRIDSGDLAYLSREARKMLDDADLDYVNITVSDSLSIDIINSIKQQGSAINDWLIGTNFVTAKENPALGGVFKLVALMKEGEKIENPSEEKSVHLLALDDSKDAALIKSQLSRWVNKIKISNNPSKVLLPGKKMMYRIIDNETNKHAADYICLVDETIDTTKPFKLIDPVHHFRKKTMHNYRVEPLLVPIFLHGKQVYQTPSLEETRGYIQDQLELLWDEQLRGTNPHPFFVNVSEELLALRNELFEKEKEKNNKK